MALARSRAPGDRERLLLAVADLCASGAEFSPAAKALVQDIFMGLVGQVEREIRQTLSEKLANADWAPIGLVSVLALDEIEIARPIIARSPVLRDEHLVRLLVEAALEHQIEVARRPGIGAVVVSAILDQAQPAVLAALAGNETAEVTPLAMQRLVIASRRLAALRGPLARHPKLTTELAHTLYGWIGETLRANIAQRFKLDPALLKGAVSDAVDDALAAHGEAPQAGCGAEPDRERDEMEQRLIDKLRDAEQLRPGYLLRTLREGRLSLFRHALATLGGFTLEQTRSATDAADPDLLALACAAVGIDRSVFPTILSLVQALNDGRPFGRAMSVPGLAETFTPAGREAAAEQFRRRAEAGVAV